MNLREFIDQPKVSALELSRVYSELNPGKSISHTSIITWSKVGVPEEHSKAISEATRVLSRQRVSDGYVTIKETKEAVS